MTAQEWASAYRPERKAEWGDIAQAIRDTVTMGELIAMYCPGLSPRQSRCPCPIHNGKDYNFSFTPHGYKCFVCGASGDVISFVKEVCELSTRRDAMKRINEDLRLGLPIDAPVSATFSIQAQKRREEAERKQAEIDAWWAEYYRLTDEWIRLDIVKRNADPNSDEYADAVKRIDKVSYELDLHLNEEKAVANH